MQQPAGDSGSRTTTATPNTYLKLALQVLDDLGLQDRCQVTDVSGAQDAYRWCLFFVLQTGQISVWGDETTTDPNDREIIVLKLRTELLNHINKHGV